MTTAIDPTSQPYENVPVERVRYGTPTQGTERDYDLPKFPEHEQALNETYMEDADTAGQPAKFEPRAIDAAYQDAPYGDTSAYFEPVAYDESHELSTWPSRRGANAALSSHTNLLEDSTVTSHHDTDWFSARQSYMTPPDSFTHTDTYTDGRTTRTHNTHSNMQHMTRQQAAAWFLTPEAPHAT